MQAEKNVILTKIVISDKLGKRITDHKAVELSSKLSLSAKGSGYWKLNCSLLQNNDFKEGMKIL